MLRLSLGKLRRKPAIRWFDESFAPIPTSNERFAHQYRDELPSEFPLTSFCAGIVHHHSGSNIYTLTPLLGLVSFRLFLIRLVYKLNSLIRVSRRV